MFQCLFVCVIKHLKNYHELALKIESMRGVECKALQDTYKKDTYTQLKFFLYQKLFGSLKLRQQTVQRNQDQTEYYR